MSDDKELPPSEKKLRKALEDDQDQQSEELNSLASLLVLGGMFYASLPHVVSLVVAMMRLELMDLGHPDGLSGRVGVMLASLGQMAVSASAVLFCTALCGGLLGNLLNRRRPPGLKMPQIQYNPLAHLKQMFRLSALLSVVRLWLIATLGMVLVGWFTWRQLPLATLGVHAAVDAQPMLAVAMMLAVLPSVLALLALSAVLDALQRRRDLIKDNRMDREEVKKENKEDNGDPLIKSKRLELARS